MFAGMAATGLPKGWGNALLVGRLVEFLNTWSGAAFAALEN